MNCEAQFSGSLLDLSSPRSNQLEFDHTNSNCDFCPIFEFILPERLYSHKVTVTHEEDSV